MQVCPRFAFISRFVRTWAQEDGSLISLFLNLDTVLKLQNFTPEKKNSTRFGKLHDIESNEFQNSVTSLFKRRLRHRPRCLSSLLYD